MIFLSSVALATVLTVGASGAAVAPCRDSSRGSRGFGLALDWERASDPGLRSGRFLRTASDGSSRVAALDCVLTAAVDSNRVAVPVPTVSQSVLPEPSSPGSPDDGSAWLRPFSFFVSTTGVYESNINHDENPVRDYGAVYGVGTHFETDTVEVEYEVASHNYQNTDRWDRISHSLTSSYDQKFSKKLSMEAVGEVALRGSSEDRELGDQYVFEPRIHYRISPSNRLRLYGAYRLRRYDENPERDATNRYVGAEFRQRLGRSALDVGYRWERNVADGPRFTYDRQTYSAQLSTPLAGGLHRLGMEVRYRPQQYAHRFVSDRHPEEGLRRDRRWIVSLGGSFALGRNFELLPGYRFETRSSNDPDKKFDSHAAYVGLRYWFGKRGNPAVAGKGPKEPPAVAAKRQEPTKRDPIPSAGTAGKPVPGQETRLASRSRRSEVPPARRPAATSSAASPVLSPAMRAQAANAEWSKRAEAERLRLVRGDAGRYAIELTGVCGARFLEEAWSYDSKVAEMWLIRSEPSCYRVFWGHYESQHDAERALPTIPKFFRSGSQRPFVVSLSAGSTLPPSSGPSR